MREKHRNVYILKESQLFWSSKISIFQLFVLFVDSKIQSTKYPANKLKKGIYLDFILRRTSQILLFYLVSKRWQINSRSAFGVSRSISYYFHAYKTGKNQKEEDKAVLKRHLTRVNLLFVRHFIYQNKGNLFLFLILAVHF